jgi:tetratricopeptide (TPR) repeat protein
MQAYEWVPAATELATAVRLDPNDLEGRVQYARLLRVSNRYAEALAQLQVARSVDPASALVLSHLAWTYFVALQMDSARVEMRHAVETDSTNLPTRYFAERVYLKDNRLAEAHAIAVGYPDGYGLAKTGDTLGARQLLRGLDARAPSWGDETQRGMTYLGLGDTASALSALERASDAKELWLITSDLGDPAYDPIRGSARFRKLLERVGVAGYYPIRSELFRRKDRRQSVVHFGAGRRTGMDPLDHARRVDEDQRRESNETKAAPRVPPIVEGYGKVHAVLVHEFLYRLGSQLLVALIHRKNHEAGVTVLLLHGDELGKLVAARRTPRPPERDHDRMPLERRQLHTPAIERGQVDLRCGRSGSDLLRSRVRRPERECCEQHDAAHRARPCVAPSVGSHGSQKRHA